MGKSLLDRAKEVMSGAGVLTSLAIAPLAMSTAVRADPITFSTPAPGFNIYSGGGMGHVYQSLFATSNTTGVLLTGDTNVAGLADTDPNHHLYPYDAHNPMPPTGYVSAAHVAANLNRLTMFWGDDGNGPSLTGHVTNLNGLALGTDFTVDTPDKTIPFSWTLTYNIQMTPTDPNDPSDFGFILNSAEFGAFGHITDQREIALPEGDLLSWSAVLDFHWDLPVDPNTMEVPNKFDRLQVDIASMYLAIDGPQAAEVTTPLPATVWTLGSLLGVVGIGRLRRVRR